MARTFLPFGLVAFYPMDEASAANRLNALNNATYVLTQSGGVTQVAGPNAGIPHATGFAKASSQKLSLSNAANFLASGPWGIHCLVKAGAGWADFDGLLQAKANGASSPAFVVGCVKTTAPGLNVYPSNVVPGFQGAQNYTEVNPDDGNWHSCIWTSDGAVLTQIIDGGKSVCSYGISPWSPGGGIDFTVGATGGGAYFDGDLCQLGVWKRQLNLNDAQMLYQGGSFLPYPF